MMTALFHPYLLNQPFGDPALYIEFMGEKNAFLFDAGDVSCLRTGKLLKVSHVFVSHTHMDHFIGFDYLLRVLLAQNKLLHVIGPKGIIKNIAGKLNGYTWNLVDSYPFVIEVSEVLHNQIKRASFVCSERFKARPLDSLPFHGVIRKENDYMVRTVHLDHKVPSLGFSLEEVFHINIKKDSLKKLALSVGPWLKDLKALIRDGKPDNWPVGVPQEINTGTIQKTTSLGVLKREIVNISPGLKIVYISDCRGSAKNIQKIVEFARNADVLFCEGAFLEKDSANAQQRGHLTAHQAGIIAREAGVRKLQIFHFSPRYKYCPEVLLDEAEKSFKDSKGSKK